MTKTTTSIEVKREGDKVVMYAMGRSRHGTKYIVNSIEVDTLPGSYKVDSTKVAAAIAEVTGRAIA